MGYRFQQFEIPDYMQKIIDDYIKHGTPAGGFLTAVLENDLMEAVGFADSTNIANLPAYSAYLYNEAPHACYGSPEKVDAWIVSHRAK